MPVSGTIIVFAVILILALVTAAKGIRTVSQGEVWTVERFGRFTHLLQPGLNFIIPYVDTVGQRMNVQEVVLDIPEQSVITRDNATVTVDGIVYFRVMDPAKAAYQVQDLRGALTALAMTNIRAVIGEMDLDQTLSSRERINSALLAILDGATDPWGVKVNRVEIRKIEPPENLIRAMNLQMTAERERRATVVRAEGAKTALVLEAEGRREAAFRDAEARERMAQAEAAATRMVAEAASGAGGDALRYFVAEKYVAAFQAMASNPSSRLVVVPMEAASLAGGVTAALELLRAPQGTVAGAATMGFPPPAGGAGPAGSVPRAGGGPWNPG
ncbi:Regulator of protease activity HflC, stomatin/prohibitin superfamily [Roseomonas rosea]|uniref:Protein QmcA n=1 Tax=Muricoccus roseus TaxID=198092 RepID=A0A1M6M698_9PROT|nr:SPFH domain-containing protein [Roseomonas rosea]SHJ78981.1 Regulator of protease activity HflC, stomatin/prohibitin superfamily [Roseomonas rosea]